MTSCFLCVLSMFLCGPSYLLNLPNSIYIIAGGQMLNQGLGMSFMAPIIPEMIDATRKTFPK